jgi:PilZ domain
MQRQDYCVYNQTNECFLSLGATLGDRSFARLKKLLNISRRRADEGSWFRPYERRHALTLFATRDLLYLDAKHRVVHIVESYPALRSVPMHHEAASLLALPVHTLSSSQTNLGNQLLICVPAEMERRLRKLFEPSLNGSRQLRESSQPVQSAMRPPERPPVQAVIDLQHAVTVLNRGASQPLASPTASRVDVGDLPVHAIRDLSATGLYLVTRDRWPIGAEINMNLQPGSGATDNATHPITVRMRVIRWGADGVGLEFAGAAAESSNAKSLYVC